MRRRVIPLALVPVLFLVACGVGGVQETTFVYGTMDAKGGTLSIPNVTLTIPAGALAGPTSVAVIPQTAAQPIQPPFGDPCTYAVLTQWCCGPVGLALLQSGQLVLQYDDSIVPAGSFETDLVLLLWDVGLGALVPAGNAAVHDTAANTFTVAAYDVLGPFAIGLRTCGVQQIIQLAVGFGNPKPGAGSTQQYGSEGLYLVADDGSTTPQHINTGGEIPASFLPSPDGQRILIKTWPGEYEGSMALLHTAVLDGSAPTYLAGLDETIEAWGAMLGWMRDGIRVFFREWMSSFESNRMSQVPGDGTQDPSELYTPGEGEPTTDFRQSLDGTMVLIAYGFVYGEITQKTYPQYSGETIDVFNAATSAPISQDVIPAGGGHNTPRFLSDSSGVYLVASDRMSVERYDPDGTNLTTLYDVPVEHGLLKDFVLAPNGDDFAYIALYDEYTIESKPQEVTGSGLDVLYVGSLSGGIRQSIALLVDDFYQEMFFHPSGQHFFIDTPSDDVRIFAASDGVQGPELNIDSVVDLDIAAGNGRLLLTVYDFGLITIPGDSIDQLDRPAPGLYVADPDGENQSLVLSAIPDLEIVAGRWLRTIRRGVCMNRDACFR